MLNIRSLRNHEIEAVLELWKAADSHPGITDSIEDVSRLLSKDHAAFLVADIDDRIVGSIIATFDGWRGIIYRLAVHPDLRRQGIARQLTQKAEETFVRWGVRRVIALVNGGFAALDAQILAGAGNDRADLRIQNPAAVEGGDEPESADRVRTRVPASFRADMGTGADKIAVNWNDPLQDANVVLGASLEVVLGGAFNLPEVDDEVLVAFEHGDPSQPIIIGALWNSEDSPPPDDSKSLSVTMINNGGRLDWASQLKGGASQDNMQLYFKGKLKVTGNARTSPRLRAAFDLGAGNDAALIDVSELVVEGTGDPAPIRVNALGGAGEDTLQFNGNGAPIRLTDDAIIQKGVARVVYAGFETVSVENLFVLSWEDLKRLSDLYGSDEVLTGSTM